MVLWRLEGKEGVEKVRTGLEASEMLQKEGQCTIVKMRRTWLGSYVIRIEMFAWASGFLTIL